MTAKFEIYPSKIVAVGARKPATMRSKSNEHYLKSLVTLPDFVLSEDLVTISSKLKTIRKILLRDAERGMPRTKWLLR